MAYLAIPEEYQAGFVKLRSLTEDQAGDLISALDEVQPTRRRTALYANLAAKVKLERVALNEVLDTLISLFAVRDDMSMSTSEFVSTLASVMDESGIEGLVFTSETNRDFFETTLTRILGISSLEVTAKTLSLVYEQDHIVHGGFRVLTDVRPIFSSESAEPSVRGAMVTYTLKFEYHDGSELRELFVALNAGQVDQLAGALERAKSKAKNLKQLVQNLDADIHYVESE